MVTLTINNKKVAVPDNATILDAARRNEIYIPTLCDDPRLDTAFEFCKRAGAGGRLNL